MFLEKIPPLGESGTPNCRETGESVQIASHKIIFVFMQKLSMFLNSNKLNPVLSVTTRHRAV